MPVLGTIASSTQQGLSTNSFFSIATTEVSSPVSYVEFTSVPNTYKYLQIRMVGRGTASSNYYTTQITFNGDTTASYAGAEIYTGGTGVTVSNTVSDNSISYGPFGPAALNAANFYGIGTIDIYGYNDTNMNTTVSSWSGFEPNRTTDPTGYILERFGTWFKTNTVSTIRLTVNSGNWAQYSRFSLYGMKDA